MIDNRTRFRIGLKDGIPIALGYFSVSFGVGIMAVKCGLSAWIGALISLTNLTSAGEAAGIGVIAAGGSFLEMILTQLLINCRYCLMGLSLSQKLDSSFTLPHRIIASYGITDEIFGVAASKEEPLTPFYMYGMISIATVGWVSGTFLGGMCGELLPKTLTQAMGIMLYGMFVAVIIPPIRKSWTNVAVILIAAAVSCVIYFVMPFISSGFAIIISAIIAAAVLAWIAPIPDEEEKAGEEEER